MRESVESSKRHGRREQLISPVQKRKKKNISHNPWAYPPHIGPPQIKLAPNRSITKRASKIEGFHCGLLGRPKEPGPFDGTNCSHMTTVKSIYIYRYI